MTFARDGSPPERLVFLDALRVTIVLMVVVHHAAQPYGPTGGNWPDEWVPLLFLVAAEPARMPQYVSLFALGVMAFRGDWLRRIPVRMGAIWLAVGLIGVAGIVAVHTLVPGDWNYHLLADGGFNWPSLLRSSLEALICAGLSVGLVVMFREAIHRPGRLIVAAAGASYGAYILHPFLLVILQVAILEVTLPAGVKLGVVAVLGVVVTFGAAYLSRKGARIAGPAWHRASTSQIRRIG